MTSRFARRLSVPSWSRCLTAIAGVTVLGLGLAACGGSHAESLSCSSYRAKGTQDRLQAVQAMLNERHSDSSLTLTELSVDAYCATHSSEQIDGIYSG